MTDTHSFSFPVFFFKKMGNTKKCTNQSYS